MSILSSGPLGNYPLDDTRHRPDPIPTSTVFLLSVESTVGSYLDPSIRPTEKTPCWGRLHYRPRLVVDDSDISKKDETTDPVL